MTGPVIFSPIRMLHSWANADDEKTIASFQALIISARPQVNRFSTPPNPPAGGQRRVLQRKWQGPALRLNPSTPISQPSPPTCALAYSFKSLSYSCVSSACRSFNAAKSFFVLSSSARIKTKPEKVKNVQQIRCETFPELQAVCLSLILSSDWLLMIFFFTKPLTFASKGDRHLISPHNITSESHIHPLTSKIALVIQLPACHTVLVELVWRIWHWMNL